MATYGYGRVSKDSQSSENQKQLIEKQLGLEVDHWYEDHATSGSVHTSKRPLFSQMIRDAKPGDTLVFSRVDRIARRASDTLTTVEQLLARGIEVYILQIGKEPLSSAKGKMMLGIFAVFAEDERLAIIERTNNGLATAKKRGMYFGNKPVMSPEVLEQACQLRAEGYTLDKISAAISIDRNTILRNIKKWGDNIDAYREDWNKRQVQYSRTNK